MANKEIIQCWVDKLRSGEIKQTRGVLREADTGECCVLGVLAHCMSGVKPVENGPGFMFDGVLYTNMLPIHAYSALKLEEPINFFWMRNDMPEHWTFDQFADYLESVYLK